MRVGGRTGDGPTHGRVAWQDAAMTDQGARYDEIAEAYAEHWSPVHRPSTLALVDEVEADVAAGARRILDVGCGTGALAVEAVRRWPRVRVDGADASAGMLRIAERERLVLPEAQRNRIRLRQAPADRLPYPDGAFDVVLTSFVLQLVPSRHRALREIRRVLAPGGRLALVTWLRGGAPLGADRVYDEVLEDAGFDPRESGGVHDDLASPSATAAVLRRAGFAEATARAATLEHRFTPESYLAFVTRFDDADEFATLAPDERRALEAELLARLRRGASSDLRLVAPIVYATGRRRAAPARPAG
jgi:ubiquinone/menaquinone biosynthesis C-methylase UbiE